MNITSLEIAQATMDMFFCLFCLIMFVSIKANNPKQKSIRMFVRLFLIATVMYFGEALAYIFRGNLGLFNILVTRIANLMVFAMNIAMANTYVRFVSSVFVEKGAEVSGNSVKIANIFSCINIFIVVVNLFYPWMYYFDEANYYHRNNSWYVYTLISLVVIFIGAGMAIKYRKYLEKRSFISMMLFSFIPIIATVVQSFIYGFSITNLGLGIGLFVMFAAYMYDWSHNGDEHTNMINDSRFDAVIMFIIMLLSMSVSIIACVNVIQQVTKENSEIQSRTIAQMVSAKIENEFIKPITVSQTISSDIDIRTYIERETREEAESVEDDITNRLVSIGNEFDYKMVFVVSDKTRAYYTYNGISRYLDVENDSHDIWYKDYLDSGKRYIVNVDTDEDNVQRLAHELTHVVTADSSDERTLRSLGAQNFDVAVVAIGDLEANMLTTLLLKEIGVPVVVVKAINQVHGKMLKKIGADKIVYSERDMGQRVAHNLISNSIVDYIELSDTISLMSITVPPSLAGKNLIESNLRSRYNVNIVAIKHGSETLVNPDPKMVLNLGDEMIIIGEHSNIKALEEVV